MRYYLKQPIPILFITSICLAGCSKPASVSYEAAALHRTADGNIGAGTTVGPVLAPISSMSKLENDGKEITLDVKEIQQGMAIFEVTYSDGTTKRIEAKRGQSIDSFAEGDQIGIRIQVKEVHLK